VPSPSYFSTIDDPLVAALTACNDGCLRRLADVGLVFIGPPV